jgi:hypothetical protein
MRRIALVCVIGLTFALFLVPSRGQFPSGKPTTKIPLTKVVLYNAGIGYFHRSGSVEGTASVELKVDREDVNDLLKTLLAEDSAGAPPRSVTFDHHASTDVALRAFALDLGVNPTIGHLLHQARGEKVAITERDGANVTGLIISVEKPTPEIIAPPVHGGSDEPVIVKAAIVPPPADAVERVNLLTDDGLQSVPLKSIKKVKFLKVELEAEFRKALETLAASRMEGKKTVAISFSGVGKRDVKVGYVAEAPLWKPSYRMSLTANAAKIQAWATIENTTDEDWSNVAVTLASGRPMTFQMDLYEPLYLPRPFVEPEAFASLRPPLYAPGQLGQLGGAFGQQGGMGIGGIGGGIGGIGGMPGGVRGANQGLGGGAFGIQGGLAGQFGIQGGSAYYVRPGVRSLSGERLSYAEFVQRLQNKAAEKNVTHAGIGGGLFSAASELSLGEPAEYKIAEPVTLPRFKTALLPIHDGALETERVSIYNASTLANNPLLGLNVKNTTGQFLPGGPIAIYDDGSFAGEARLADLRKDQTRLVSYAIDLLTRVQMADRRNETVRDDSVIELGILRRTQERRFTQPYLVRTSFAGPRKLLIEHPRSHGRTLVTPEKPEELTKETYRFAVTAKPGEITRLEVAEVEKLESVVDLAKLTKSELDEMRASAKKVDVKAILDRLAKLNAELDTTKLAIVEEQNALKVIDIDQSRLRANIEKVPRDSDVYKRYLKKFDEQETEIETRRKKIAELTAVVESKGTELAVFLKGASAK